MYMQSLFILLLSVLMIDTVKIGISKPVSLPENVTTESIETTTPEPTTTTTYNTTSTATSTSTNKIQTTSSTTLFTTTPSTITSTLSSTISTSTAAPILKNGPALSPIRNQNKAYSGYFCSCDLKHGHCDINCCCDIDCILEELNSFSCQRGETHLKDIHYQQGLPPCKINEGWLCVFRNNFDDTKHKELNYVLDNNRISQYNWPQLLLETNDLNSDRSYYKIGEPLLLYSFELNEIIEYDIPFSFVGQNCQIFESIRHLTPQRNYCYMTIEKVQSLESILFQKLCTSFLLQRPNIQIPIDGVIKETQTEFIPIILNRCTKNFDCVPASINSSFFGGIEDWDYSSLIQTKIYHNITSLIRCDVFFVRSDHRSNKVWQQYEVKFIHINETNEVSSYLSGPLGYNVGSPLIIGHKVLLNESADHIDSNLILNYFHPNRTESVHIFLPQRKHGRCKKSQLSINFGESIQVQCSIELDNSTELNSETNFTRVCGDLQSRSIQILQGNDILGLQDDYFVSILGYPQNKTNHWTKIEVKDFEYLPVVGSYLDKDYSFICQNMILDLKYEFLTVRDNIQGVPHQNILKRATIQVGRRHDLQFQLDEVISMPVTLSVVFQDLREISNSARQSLYCGSVVIGLFTLTYFNNLFYK